MSNALLLAALAATGITYEWRSVDDAQGGHEYVVTVEPGLLQAALDGKANSFRSDVPDDVERIRSVVVNLGEGAAEPVRHGVLKPPVDADAAADEEFAPIRHSVYQQTYPPQTYPPQAYPNPTAIEQGFSDYNAAVEPRKSIGSEVAKGTEKLLNGTGRIIQDTGEAIEGTAKNIGDGFRSIVKPSSVTPTGGVAAPQASGTYQPFSYNQPTPNPNYNAGGAYPPLPTQPGVSAQAGQAYPGSQSYPAGMNQPPIGPPVSVQQAPQNQNAPTYPPSNQPPAGVNGPSSADPSQFASQRSNTGGQAYVDFAPQRDEPFAPIRDAQPTGNTPDYRSNQGPNSQPPNNQQPYGGQNYAAGQYNQPPSATNDSWPDWPDASQTAGNQNQYPQNNGGPYPGSPTTAGYGSTPGPQAPNPAAWNPNAIDGPSIADTQQRNQQDAANATNNPGGGGKQGWYAVVAVAAIGSIAWNFYLGMNYIDARNKYRAALRRSGRAYSEVLDDM